MDFLDEAKERFENLKKLSGELRDDVIENTQN